MAEYDPYQTQPDRVGEMLTSVQLRDSDEDSPLVRFDTDPSLFPSAVAGSINQFYRIEPSAEILAFMESVLQRPADPADYHRFSVKVKLHAGGVSQYCLSVDVNGQAKNVILGLVPDEALTPLKGMMRKDYLAEKELFDAIPPFHRRKSVCQESQLRRLLDLSGFLVGSLNDRNANRSVSMIVPTEYYGYVREKLGITQVQMSGSKFPHLRFLQNEDMLAAFGGMVYGNAAIEKDYHLEIIEHGSDGAYLMGKYSQILGSRKFGRIPDDFLEQFKEAMCHGVAQSLKLEYKVDSQKASAAGDIPEVAKQVSDPELMGQISTLVAVDNRMELPEGNLSRYADIKTAMLKAGGKYKSAGKSLPAHFVFHPSVNAKALLEQISGGEKVNIQKETQFFATAEREAIRLIDSVGDIDKVRVLEPSAGQAGIADVAKSMGAGEIVTIENWGINAEVLRSKGYDPIEKDFLQVRPEDTGAFDVVLMNPPFSGRQDLAHVRHALSFLKVDGRLGAITSRQYETSSIKDCSSFRGLLETAGAKTQTVDQGAFKEAGTMVSTSIISINMATLLERLEQAGSDGSEFGIDLSRQWAALDASRETPAQIQRAA